MNLPTHQKPLVIVLSINAALLAAILLTLLTRSSSPQFIPAALAQNQLPIGGGGGVFIVPAQFSDNSYGCYIMDIDAQTICAYQYFERQLRLMAARNFRYDRRLNQFNSERPTPQEVQRMVEQEQEASRVRDVPTRRVDPEAPQRLD